jgi:IclR family transcriptional regulator, pca regulon regulatory protein
MSVNWDTDDTRQRSSLKTQWNQRSPRATPTPVLESKPGQIAAKTNRPPIGYIAADGNHFRLLPKVLDLGYSYLSSVPMWEQAQPFMKSIVDKIDESCSLGVLDGPDIVYIARIPPTHMHTIAVHVGSRLPAFVNTMGRVLLAELSESALDQYFQKTEFKKLTSKTISDETELRKIFRNVRKDGYALAIHEVYEGRGSLAVPIRNREGVAVASINVSAMLSRASKADFLNRFLPLMRDAAKGIGASI